MKKNIKKILVGGFIITLAVFLNVSPAQAVGLFLANQIVANVSASTIPSVTFAGGTDAVNGNVPPITFTGGSPTTAATAVITITAPLANAAADQVIIIDGVTINLGPTARSASLVADVIENVPSFAPIPPGDPIGHKDYSVVRAGAVLTFTKDAVGAAGNGSLTIQDDTYTRVNAAAATTIVGIPTGIVANATDHSVTIDGVTIDLGTAALSAAQVATAIASDPFTGKNYTVTPLAAAIIFTRNLAGVAGNGALTIQDASFGAVAQVVTFTPSLVTDGETFRATINGTNYDYIAQTVDTVALVVAGLTPIIDAHTAVDCVNSASLLITCTASVAGTPFTFTSEVFAAAPAPVTPSPGERGGSSHIIGSSGVGSNKNNNTNVPGFPNTGSVSATIAPDGTVLCPNGMTLTSNCSIAPVLGICPNGLTLVSNCTVASTNIPFTLGSFNYDFGATTVRQGSSGPGCSAWQNFLNVHRNAGLVVDGKCGSLTMAAATSWQASAGLVADGLLGPMSRTKANAQAASQ